jgi:hypothetical protein
MNVRFSYDIVSRKSAELRAGDFEGCETYEQFHDELIEQTPYCEWSVYPNEDDAQKLWALVQSQRGAPEAE